MINCSVDIGHIHALGRTQRTSAVLRVRHARHKSEADSLNHLVAGSLTSRQVTNRENPAKQRFDKWIVSGESIPANYPKNLSRDSILQNIPKNSISIRQDTQYSRQSKIRVNISKLIGINKESSKLLKDRPSGHSKYRSGNLTSNITIGNNSTDSIHVHMNPTTSRRPSEVGPLSKISIPASRLISVNTSTAPGSVGQIKHKENDIKTQDHAKMPKKSKLTKKIIVNESTIFKPLDSTVIIKASKQPACSSSEISAHVKEDKLQARLTREAIARFLLKDPFTSFVHKTMAGRPAHSSVEIARR